MITSTRGCVPCNNFWPWPIYWRSFSHVFAMKLLKYDTFCLVRCTALTIWDEFFPYLAQMITSMRWCVACSDLWPWPISSKLFSCDIAYFKDFIHMWHKCNPWGDNVKSQGHTDHLHFCSWGGGILVDHWSTISSSDKWVVGCLCLVFVPEGIKPLAEPVLINHQWGLLTFTWGQLQKNSLRYRALIWVCKFIIWY